MKHVISDLSDEAKSIISIRLEKRYTVAPFCVPVPINGAELRHWCQEAAMDNFRNIITSLPSKA